MTVNRALAIARQRCDMHRMGGRWIITHYDPTVDAMRELYSRPYAQAREDLTQIQADEALRALGHTPDAYGWPLAVVQTIEGRGTLRSRVENAVAHLRPVKRN